MTAEQNENEDRDSGQWFRDMMQADSEQRREASEAFSQEVSKPVTTDELLAYQQKYATQIAELSDEIGRLRRSTRFVSLLSVSIVLLLVAAGVTVSLRPDLLGRLTPAVVASADQSSAAGGQGAPMPDFEFEEEKEFKIRTDVDRKYQIVIRELYRRLRRIRLYDRVMRDGATNIEDRNARNDFYIRYITDVLAAFEEASDEQVSGEILTALANLAEVGKVKRTVRNNDELDLESKNKLEQIERLIDAPDLRSSSAEI